MLGAGFVGARPAAAQPSLYLVNDSTTVGEVGFRFDSTRTFEPPQLQLRVATRGPSGLCERGFLSRILRRLPFCGDRPVYPFNPVELQKDVRRLERYYRSNGFPFSEVDYLVRLDTTRNAADVLFTIAEGTPITIDTVRFTAPNGRAAIESFPARLQDDWARLRGRITLQQGERLDDFRVLSLQNETLRWLRERGYAFANVSAQTEADTAALLADVTIKLDAGPQARYDEVVVTGVESVEERIVLRELPFDRGDVFQESELTEGQQQVFGLGLFQLAAVDILPGQPRDSTVDLRATVSEGPQRVLDALTGFYGRGGLTGRVQWTHRNFLGGARTFTASLTAQTGAGAFSERTATAYEAQVTLRQPYVLNRRFSGSVSPFVRSRDDEIEASRAYGLNGALLYERGPLRTASLGYTYLRRRVLNAAEGGLLEGGLLDTSLVVPRSEGRLSATLGRADDVLNPRRGFIVRPFVAASGPPLSDIPYGLAGASLSGFLPFGERAGLVARVNGTMLRPFGGTDLADYRDYVGTRDVLAFAGGTGDVRGWGSSLLGPLFFDLQVPDPARLDSLLDLPGELVLPPAEADTFYTEVIASQPYYLPVGGEAKVSASLQANLPLPLANFGASVFADVGGVWRPGQALYALFERNPETPNGAVVVERFRREAEGLRYGVGAGLQYLTPVGFLNFAVGVKLNPSYFDLRDPVAVYREADLYDLDRDTEPDLDSVPTEWFRRLQFHLAIGQTF